MAQLSDDCFAFGGALLPVAEMERMIAARIVPVATIETVPLTAARGRVVARDIAAPIDLPPFDNSAVDGFAVRHADLAAAGDTRLAVVDRVTAGRAATHALGPGEAVRIFTGAPMPAGADTVFMQEDTRTEGGTVIVPPGLKRGANSRAAGEDARKGAVVLPAGRRLSTSHVALAAAVGITDLPVRRRVRVAVFSTGDEIVEPGTLRPPAALFDANRFLLAGLIEGLGATFTDLGILPDDKARLSRAIADAARSHDLVLTSGGVSTGEADHVKSAVEDIGKLVFWRVGIKPGRPVAMGVIPSGEAPPAARPRESGDPGLPSDQLVSAGLDSRLRGNERTERQGAAFVGLPGNPVAVFVTFARVVRPLLLRLAGAEVLPLIPLPVRAGFPYKKRSGRREYVRVKLVQKADGSVEAFKHAQDGAGVITSLTETDGLIELLEDATTVAPGATVGFLSYASLVE
jgi:molybdopterin molybdotransferase